MISVLRVSLPGDVDIDDFLRTHSELHVESVRRAGDVGRLVRVADTSGFNATIASGGRFSDLLVRTIALLERMQPALGYARSVGAILEVDFGLEVGSRGTETGAGNRIRTGDPQLGNSFREA